MLHITVELEGGAKVTTPFDAFRLREEVEFERYFGLSATVLQRYAERSARIEEWRILHPPPADDAPVAEKEAWTEASTAFLEELREQAPPQEHMVFMAWLRVRKVDPSAVPDDFEAFLDAVTRLVYFDPELEPAEPEKAEKAEASTNGNGHAPAKRPRGRPRKDAQPATSAGDPTAPVAPSSS